MNAPVPMKRFPGRPLGQWQGIGTSYTPGKLMWWHDAIIDEMLANPHLNKKDIASKLNCTPTFIYMITNSDLFAARWEQRRGEHSEAIGAALLGKLNRVAEKTLDRILEQVEDEGKSLSLNQLESLADKTLGRLGYGPKRDAPSPMVNVSVAGAAQVIVPATREELEAARSLIQSHEKTLAAGASEPPVVRAAEGFEPGASGPLVEGERTLDGTFTFKEPE